MLKQAIVTATALCAFSGIAAANVDVPITGNIESKCVITTDTPGVFGNPTPDKLSTVATDGGVLPIVRYDIIEADYYKAQITFQLIYNITHTERCCELGRRSRGI